MTRGGVLVLSNIRGGSEYGPQLARPGCARTGEGVRRLHRDLRDLIRTGVTTPKLLRLISRSNGGLLMGAMMNQRPGTSTRRW